MQSPHQNRGFTLIEMLAVVAIVGILAAVTFPAWSSARNKAATTQCVANLRILARAHQAYRNEHDGRGPANSMNPSDPAAEGHNGPGVQLLRAYYRDGDRVIWTSDHKYIEESVEKCPSREIPGDPREYMMAVLFKDGKAGEGSFVGFTHPAQTPLFWDGFNPGSGNVRTKIPLRHNEGINMAFLDGHVEYLSGDDQRLYSDYLSNLFNKGTPDPVNLGKGQKLGVTSL